MSDARAVERFRTLAGPTTPGEGGARTLGWWGMAMAVATEGALFGVLLASYFYLKWYADEWPPPGVAPPEFLRPSIILGLMLLSAPAMLQAARRGSDGGVPWLAATLVLGLSWLGVQAWDLAEKAQLHRPQDSAYSSMDFLLTGGHAVHVVVGVVLVAWVLARRGRAAPVANLYWQFLVAVNVAVYLTVTVSPNA